MCPFAWLFTFCPVCIQLASKQGDSIISVDYQAKPDTFYPVSIHILAIERRHLLKDIMNIITEEFNLCIDKLDSATDDSIVNCTISFGVHSFDELQTINSQISSLKGIEEVKILIRW